MTLEEFLSRLNGVKQVGSNQWEARCPGHDDNCPSLRISIGKGGAILLRCMAGCPIESILAAIGMEKRDLFPDTGRRASGLGRIAATYDYHDAGGVLTFQVVRFTPKNFRQRRPDGAGGWTWSLKDVARPLPLYRLPALLRADPSEVVFFVEGEKDVENLRGLNLPATTNPMGAEKVGSADLEPLRGRMVAIMPDNDSPGEAHAAEVARALEGVAARVGVLRLPGLADKQDVSDWLSNGGTADELQRLAAAALEAGVNGLHVALQDGSGQQVAASETGPATPSTRITIPLSDVAPVATAWLWDGYFPLGAYVVLGGNPSTGKTTLALGVAAIVTRGARWPDGSRAPQGSVLVISAEDDPARTIVPRLVAAGADLSRCSVMPILRRDKENQLRAWTIDDLDALEQALDETRASLVILDPLQGLIPSTTDTHNNSSVRGVLGGLCELAARRDVTLIGIDHLRKSGADAAIYRVTGSIAFAAASRATFVCAPDPADPSRNVLACAKCNLSALPASQAYRLTPAAGPVGPVVVAEWAGPVAMTADELLRPPKKRVKDQEFEAEVQEFATALREAIGMGQTFEGAVGQLCELMGDEPDPRRLGADLQRMKVVLPRHGIEVKRLPRDPNTRARRVSVAVAAGALHRKTLSGLSGLSESRVSDLSQGGGQGGGACPACPVPPEKQPSSGQGRTSTDKHQVLEFGHETTKTDKPDEVDKLFDSTSLSGGESEVVI